MTAGRDYDDALTWGGDEDPTLDVGSSSDAALPEGWSAVGKGSEALRDGTDVSPTELAPAEPTPAEPTPAEPTTAASPSNAVLIALGVLAGFYLLFTLGWVIGGLRLQGRAQYLVTDVMFQGSFWLAALAPLLWFGTVFLLTRTSRTWVRIAWLVAGAILLVPWPFIMVGAVGL